MTGLVGWSRIYRGEHHPLDVAGGILLALGWLAAVTIALRPNADLDDPGQSASLETSPAPAPGRSAPAGTPSSQAGRPGDKDRDSGTSSAVVANPAKVTDADPRRAQIQAALASAGWPRRPRRALAHPHRHRPSRRAVGLRARAAVRRPQQQHQTWLR